MRHAIIVVLLAPLLAAPPSTRAQGVPDFSGSWSLSPGSVVRERNLAAGEVGTMSAPMGHLKITQTGGLLALSGGRLTAVYRLDGTPTKNQFKMGDKLMPATGRARWEGGRLFLTSGLDGAHDQRQSTIILSFDERGNMVVESRTAGPGTNLGFKSLFTKEVAALP